MKKSLVLILIVLLISALVFAACDPSEIVQDVTDGTQSGQTTDSGNVSGNKSADSSQSGGNASSGSTETGTGNGESQTGTGDNNQSGNGGEQTPSTSDLYTKDGDTITFGSYPQTKMTNETLVAALNGLAGGLPGRTEDDYGWTSYKYYHGTGEQYKTTNEEDYMWYKDVTYEGERYRGVYFSQYRPDLTTRQIGVDRSYSFMPTNTFQYRNEYRKTVAYWFRYEPIQWRVMEEKNGSALLIADVIIDSQAYLDVAEYVGLDDHSNSIYMNSNDGVPEETYANNYMYSSIRKWLNDTFYNTAFTALQKELIALTTVDNGITSSKPIKGNSEVNWNSGTKYLCADTSDYIFLPSEAEVTTEKYGFSDFMERYANDKKRIRKYSDYALSQGLWAHGSAYTQDELYGEYWLRSPHQENDGGGSGMACNVDEEGYAANADFVINTAIGVLPMLWIKL